MKSWSVRTARLLLWAALACSLSAPFCRAENVTVHVLNVKDGSGFKNIPIEVLFGYPKVKGPPLSMTTGVDGTAVFTLPDPVPERFLVETAVWGKIVSCSLPSFTTREVLHRGVVATIRRRDSKCCPHGRPNGTPMARPGEVFVFVRTLRWFENMQD